MKHWASAVKLLPARVSDIEIDIAGAVAPTHAQLQPLFAASASAGVLWELALLQHHYHPHVAAKAKAVAQRSSAGACVDAPLAEDSQLVQQHHQLFGANSVVRR